jgi:putative ABC transport system ATP-binding protein
MLKLQNIQLIKRGKTLFGPLDYEFNSDGHIVITAASGVGKSCLLRLLAGLERPDSGKVFYKSNELVASQMHLHRRQVIYISQDPALFGDTIFDALCLPSTIRSQVEPAQDLLEHWLFRLGLDYLSLDSTISGLSGGEKRRVVLIRALLCNPEILLLDEPTTGLDKKSESKIFELFFGAEDTGFNTEVISASHSDSWIDACQTVLQLSSAGGLKTAKSSD